MDSPQCINRSAVSVKALDGKHITQIACGHNTQLPSILRVSFTYGDTTVIADWDLDIRRTPFSPHPSPTYAPPHRNLLMVPCQRLIVSQFTGPNPTSMGRLVVAGPSNSVVIDRQGMYWMAGKVSHLQLYHNSPYLMLPSQWKNTGDGKSSIPGLLFQKPDHRSKVLLGPRIPTSASSRISCLSLT